MGIGWMILIFFGGLLVFFFLLGKMTWGTGADLVDWDPTRRQEAKMDLEAQDSIDLLEITNRRRRAAGLDELGENDVIHEIARKRRGETKPAEPKAPPTVDDLRDDPDW
jgi:hypothetical protein